MYTIDWHLKKWMQETLIQNTAIVIDIDNGTVKDALYINLAKDENLVKYIRTQGNAMIFHLTSQGEIALGIQDPATEPAAPPTGARETGQLRYQAQTWDTVSQDWTLYAVIDTETGERVTEPTRLMTFANMQATAMNAAAHLPQRTPATPQPESVGTGDGEPPYSYVRDDVFRDGEAIGWFSSVAQKVAITLNTETSALRTELAAARERIAELTAENNRLQEAIESAYDHACTASKELGYGNDEIAQEYILKTKAVLGEIVLSDD